MNSKKKYLYNDLFKEARQLYDSLGIVVILFLLVFGFIRGYIFMPLMSKAWALVLTTTPDGFISTSNLLNTLIKSPWITLAALILIIAYALFAVWQTSALILGIAYARRGQRVSLGDLIRNSFSQISGRVVKENWMMLVYALVITPLANIYHASDLIERFVVPEYIQDFINSKIVLSIGCIILAIGIIYVALRWLFLFPVFILKKKDFKEAKKESDTLTEGNFIKNGLNMIFYSVVEFIRLSILPIAIILIPVFICYLCTYRLDYATNLFSSIGITVGLEFAKNITSTLVQISVMCFLLTLYTQMQKEEGMQTAVKLPPIETIDETNVSINVVYIVTSIIFSALIATTYLAAVNTVQKNPEVILEIFGKTEIIAHKGYSSKAPENTMPAFELADKSEAVTYSELDVRSTKDGIPVVIHEASIKDATGVDKQIYECTYDEIKDLPAPYAMDAEKFPNAKIPTLEEVISEYAHNTPLLIEIKGYDEDPDLPKKIVALMHKYQIEDTSLIQSGNYKALEAVKEIDPDISCGLILAMVTGNYYDLPYANFYSIEHNFVNQNTVLQLHKLGKKVFAWTVNYDDSAEALKFSGVDGIITDVPDEINKYVGDVNDLVEDVFFDKLFKFDFEKAINALRDYDLGEY